MILFLIRHPESTKNTENRFSSIHDLEPLTDEGLLDASRLANQLVDFSKKFGFRCRHVFCASSLRAQQAAHMIADKINAELITTEDLLSTRPGDLAGKSEAEAVSVSPKFVNELYLFRKGLFNAYDFNVANGKEPKKKFEERVSKYVQKIIGLDEDFSVIIAHRSTITFILIYFARLYHHYPSNFSGHIQLDLAKVSLIRKLQDKWIIEQVNEPLEKILSSFSI